MVRHYSKKEFDILASAMEAHGGKSALERLLASSSLPENEKKRSFAETDWSLADCAEAVGCLLDALAETEGSADYFSRLKKRGGAADLGAEIRPFNGAALAAEGAGEVRRKCERVGRALLSLAGEDRAEDAVYFFDDIPCRFFELEIRGGEMCVEYAFQYVKRGGEWTVEKTERDFGLETKTVSSFSVSCASLKRDEIRAPETFPFDEFDWDFR